MGQVLSYKPVERVSSVDAVETKIRNDILSGRLLPGDRLPPERELAELLGVNRLTLRTALSRLVAAKLLISQQGDGNRVLDYRLHSGFERLPELAEAVIDDPPFVAKSIADLLALRRSILIDAIAEGVVKATPHQVEHLRGLILRQEEQAANQAAFMEGDFEISRHLLAVADNLAYTLVFNTIIRFARGHSALLGCMFAEPAMTQRGYRGLLALFEEGAEFERSGIDLRTIVRQGLEFQDAEHMRRINIHLNLSSKSVITPGAEIAANEPARKHTLEPRKPKC